MDRSKNDLLLAETTFTLSKEKKAKKIFNIPEEITFYSNVISLSYYSIFYSAKAFLLSKNISTSPPSEHSKVLNHLKELVNEGVIDFEILKVYEEETIKAETIISIYREEKNKRSQFTYQKLPQSNQEPAQQSIANANKFRKIIIQLLKVS
jgi:uncharacterized protein (UPF0332 family)